MNEQADDFRKGVEVINAMTNDALNKLLESFVHSSTPNSDQALRECMQQLEGAIRLICKLHDVARVQLTGREEPVEEEQYKLRATRCMAPKESPPFAFDPEEFGIDSDDD